MWLVNIIYCFFPVLDLVQTDTRCPSSNAYSNLWVYIQFRLGQMMWVTKICNTKAKSRLLLRVSLSGPAQHSMCCFVLWVSLCSPQHLTFQLQQQKWWSKKWAMLPHPLPFPFLMLLSSTVWLWQWNAGAELCGAERGCSLGKGCVGVNISGYWGDMNGEGEYRKEKGTLTLTIFFV